MVFVGAAHDPVQHVHGAVCAEGDEVEGVDYGRYGGLAEEEELGDDAEGFEDFGEDPEDLTYALVGVVQGTGSAIGYLEESAVPDDIVSEDQVPERRNDDAA